MQITVQKQHPYCPWSLHLITFKNTWKLGMTLVACVKMQHTPTGSLKHQNLLMQSSYLGSQNCCLHHWGWPHAGFWNAFQLNHNVGDCLGRFLSIHSSRKLQFLHNIHTVSHLIIVLSEYGLVIYCGSYLKIIYIGHAQLVFFWVSALCRGRKFHLNHIRSPWRWSQYIPLKCQNLQPLSGAEAQKRPATDQQPLWKPKN